MAQSWIEIRGRFLMEHRKTLAGRIFVQEENREGETRVEMNRALNTGKPQITCLTPLEGF
jgi:hypothetical protein